MARYGKGAAEHRHAPVQCRIWQDKGFNALSKPPPNAQTLLLFLLTTEHRRLPGVIVAPMSTLAEELGWQRDALDACLKELEGAEMAASEGRLIYLCNAFRQDCNHPSSPSDAVKWRKIRNDLPEVELVKRIDRDIKKMLGECDAQALADGKPANWLSSYLQCKRQDRPPPAVLPARQPEVQAERQAERHPVAQPVPLHEHEHEHEHEHGRAPTPTPTPTPTLVREERPEGYGRRELNADWERVVGLPAGDASQLDELLALLTRFSAQRKQTPRELAAHVLPSVQPVIAGWSPGAGGRKWTPSAGLVADVRHGGKAFGEVMAHADARNPAAAPPQTPPESTSPIPSAAETARHLAERAARARAAGPVGAAALELLRQQEQAERDKAANA